jgi:hypothetical protein
LPFMPQPEEPRILCDVSQASGFMVTKFMVLPDGHARLVNVQGDVEGVTGYTKDEFMKADIMKILALKQDTVQKIFEEVERTGVCNKITYFKKRSGEEIKVCSTVIKIFENTYIELTTLSNQTLHL